MEKDIVELIKERVRIEDVIAQDGFPLPTRGRYRKCTTAHTGGLVVDVQRQYYYWNMQAEGGDVINWVINRRTHDFKGAVEELARRYALPDPDWGRKDHAERMAARACQNVLEVATQVFSKWFWASQAAKTYVQSRGFTVERAQESGEDGEDDRSPTTAVLARLGFTGEGGAGERQEMEHAFRTNGVDLLSPAAVAVRGFDGDVAGWASAHQIQDINKDWIDRRHIPGLLDRPRLCYPHIEFGQVRYISTRSIGEKFHYNLPECLIGKRRMFFNHQWGTNQVQAVIVEGQADAITWGQWGIPAIALAGVSPDDDLAEILKPFLGIYIAMDMDVTGVNAAWALGQKLGPRVRLVPPRDPASVSLELPDDAPQKYKEAHELATQVLTATSAIMRWPFPVRYNTFSSGNEEKAVKDSNDVLRAFVTRELAEEEHSHQAQLLLDRSPSVVEVMCSWAGARDGVSRESAMKTAAGLVNKLDDFSLAQQKGRLAKLLQIGSRDLDRMLKAERVQSQKRNNGESVFTWGGYIDGWLVEYLYDPKEDTASLAWRDPDGKVDSGPGVQIEGRYYEPCPPNEMFRLGSLYYPSALGDKKSIRELLTYLRMYLNSVYIIPSDQLTRLVSYWILQTYMFDAFQSTIYLRAIGDAGSGKSEFLYRVGLVCYRMLMASGTDSLSSLFRTVHRYHNTVILDEADMENSETENERVKFLNQGAFKGKPIMRTKEITGPDGEKDWESVTFDIYCPKMIGARKDFRDDAVGTRTITLKLVAREPAELIAAKVPLVVTREILERSQALRNLLLRYRLENWQPEIEIDPDWYDLSVSARLNQVAGSLLAIARDDPDQQEEIRQVLRDYYAETILNRSMTKEARVLEALWKIWNYPELHKNLVKVDEEGNSMIKNVDVTRVTNELMDEMNETDAEADADEKADWKKKRKDITPHTIGRILRETFLLKMSERKRDGFWVYWNQPRLEGLCTKYGINPADFTPQATAATKPVAPPKQGELPV